MQIVYNYGYCKYGVIWATDTFLLAIFNFIPNLHLKIVFVCILIVLVEIHSSISGVGDHGGMALNTTQSLVVLSCSLALNPHHIDRLSITGRCCRLLRCMLEINFSLR